MKASLKRIIIGALVGLAIFLLPIIICSFIPPENTTSKTTTQTFGFNVGDAVYLDLGEDVETAYISNTDTDFVMLLKYIDEGNHTQINKLLKNGRVFRVDRGTPVRILAISSRSYNGETLPLCKVKVLFGKYKDKVGWVAISECKKTFQKPNLELVGGIKGTHYESVGYGYGYIVGYLKNNTDRSYNYVQISFSLYDKNGNKVGSAFDNTNGLGPRETWKFKALVMNDQEVESYKVEDITAW